MGAGAACRGLRRTSWQACRPQVCGPNPSASRCRQCCCWVPLKALAAPASGLRAPVQAQRRGRAGSVISVAIVFRVSGARRWPSAQPRLGLDRSPTRFSRPRPLCVPSSAAGVCGRGFACGVSFGAPGPPSMREVGSSVPCGPGRSSSPSRPASWPLVVAHQDCPFSPKLLELPFPALSGGRPCPSSAVLLAGETRTRHHSGRFRSSLSCDTSGHCAGLLHLQSPWERGLRKGDQRLRGAAAPAVAANKD